MDFDFDAPLSFEAMPLITGITNEKVEANVSPSPRSQNKLVRGSSDPRCFRNACSQHPHGTNLRLREKRVRKTVKFFLNTNKSHTFFSGDSKILVTKFYTFN